MDKDKVYAEILKAQLVPAFECTEPIAIQHCAAKARELLGKIHKEVRIVVVAKYHQKCKERYSPQYSRIERHRGGCLCRYRGRRCR